MIVLLALFSATVLEFPQPNADRIVVEAVVRTGRLDPREEAAADLLALTLRSGTANLTRGQLLQYGTMAGERMRVQRLPDSFRIGLTVPRGNLETAAVLLDELLRYATFDEGPVKATLDELPFRKPEPWLEALRPFRFEYAKLEREDVLDLYRKAFRPEHTTVAVWGGFAPGEAKSHFEDRWQDWKALPIAKRFRPSLNRTRAETRPHSLSTIELEGPEFRGADGDFAAKLLAAFALGGGKWSSMHRILREKQAWTYRQEAVLWPTEEGLRIRLISALAASDGDLGLAQKMRDALLADVDSWTEAELQRAVGFARASFAMQGWATPMYLGHDAPISTSEADSTFLRAWWHMKSGKAWDQQAVLASMEAVKLEELKEASLEMLKEATPRVITGRKPD